MSLQIGNFNPDGSLNTTGSPAGNNVFNLVQMVVLNYMALHGAGASAAACPTLVSGAQLEQHLGTGSALDPLIAYQPIASGERKDPRRIAAGLTQRGSRPRRAGDRLPSVSIQRQSRRVRA